LKDNLPSIQNVFMGREREIATIEHALADPDINIIVIVGFKGIGKNNISAPLTPSTNS
jgi:hypothetical protein